MCVCVFKNNNNVCNIAHHHQSFVQRLYNQFAFDRPKGGGEEEEEEEDKEEDKEDKEESLVCFTSARRALRFITEHSIDASFWISFFAPCLLSYTTTVVSRLEF